MDDTQETLVAQFCEISGATPAAAQNILTSTNWNLQDAVSVFYANQDLSDASADEQEDTNPQIPQPIPTSSTTAPPHSSTSSNRKQPSTSKMKTIRDLTNDGSGSDSDDDHKRDLFAGGEKSGLAVQDPNRAGERGPPDHFNNLLNQARRNVARPESEDTTAPPPRSNAFQGRAQTLGGDEAPSQVIEDPNASTAPRGGASGLPRVQRTLHLWQDGFSIDDGILHRFDDPANAPVLALINQGRAPLSLLDVQPGQEVDLQLDTHRDQNYVAPKKVYKPFGGSGQRLGSPTPGPSATSAAQPAAAPAAAAASAPSSSTASPTVNVDESTPVITLQIRLGDGTRLQSRFNTTHTVGDVYDFVNRANTASASQPYALMTTFPSKELSDKAIALGDMAEFKRGGVVVQKWIK